MNKQLAKKGATLNKNMTNTESLVLDTLTITNNIVLPVYTDAETPKNPVQGTTYLRYNSATGIVDLQCYINGAWQ